jgi:protein-tyrosine phosphatase
MREIVKLFEEYINEAKFETEKYVITEPSNALLQKLKNYVKDVKEIKTKSGKLIAFIVNRNLFFTTNVLIKEYNIVPDILSIQMTISTYAVKDYNKKDLLVRKVYDDSNLVYTILKSGEDILVGLHYDFVLKYVDTFKKINSIISKDIETKEPILV